MAKDRFLTKGVTTKRQRDGKPVSSSGKPHQRQHRGSSSREITGRHGRRGGSDDDNDDNEGESGDEVGDIDDLEHRHEPDENELSSEDEFLETAAEKRLRLAKGYISKVKESTSLQTGEFDAAEIDRDIIAERLMSDAKERTGRWSRRIADQFAYPLYGDKEKDLMKVLKNGHRLPVTCVAITPDGKYVYSGSKDGSLIKWARESGKRLKVFYGQKKKPQPNYSLGHCDHILSIAVSADGKYVATGGRDRRIHIWSVEEDEHLTVFHQHKDAVTGLVFRRGTNHLYSCSADRMVKMWNIDELAYMDTLFGHQDSIIAIDALQREQAVTTGGRDKTVRLWKIEDEAQLVFRGGSATDQHRLNRSIADSTKYSASNDNDALEKIVSQNSLAEAKIQEHSELIKKLASEQTEFHEESIDAVAMVDEETYVTGSDSGALSLWSVHKKKPVFIQHVAHGVQEDFVNDDGYRTATRPRWITALAAVPFTDLLVSASSDGFVRMWRMRPGKTQGFDLVNAIPVPGFVNGLAVREMSASGDILSNRKDLILAVAIGQEPRLGRWAKEKARNAVKVFHLPARASGKQ
ncbi:WD40 repeat-like protein [Martensiomyces pterosporus]|nr:WD40 repeat-like protein [Martensiomyces pterosporus]